jgi:hypothetical protein
MQIVFSCPNCGASQSVDDSASSTQCQFCGNTIAVPAALRGAGPQPSSPYASGTPASGAAGVDSGHDQTKLAAIGDAVRAGNKAEAARLYRETFGGGLAAAQQAVDKLAAGQEILVGTTAMGAPEYLQVSTVAPAAPYAYYAPMMTPVMPDTNRIWRGVMGFNIAITLAIFAFTGCIILFVFLAVGLALFPGLLGLGQILSQLTPR